MSAAGGRPVARTRPAGLLVDLSLLHLAGLIRYTRSAQI
jgi:hypothetical protein